MTAPEPILCPECGGEQMVGHPAGALVFRHVDPCSLSTAEDATAATDAERALLGTPVPAVLWCTVTYVTASIRRRTFK